MNCNNPEKLPLLDPETPRKCSKSGQRANKSTVQTFQEEYEVYMKSQNKQKQSRIRSEQVVNNGQEIKKMD